MKHRIISAIALSSASAGLLVLAAAWLSTRPPYLGPVAIPVIKPEPMPARFYLGVSPDRRNNVDRLGLPRYFALFDDGTLYWESVAKSESVTQTGTVDPEVIARLRDGFKASQLIQHCGELGGIPSSSYVTVVSGWPDAELSHNWTPWDKPCKEACEQLAVHIKATIGVARNIRPVDLRDVRLVELDRWLNEHM